MKKCMTLPRPRSRRWQPTPTARRILIVTTISHALHAARDLAGGWSVPERRLRVLLRARGRHRVAPRSDGARPRAIGDDHPAAALGEHRPDRPAAVFTGEGQIWANPRDQPGRGAPHPGRSL